MIVYLDEPIIINGIKISHTEQGLIHLIEHYTHILENTSVTRTREVETHMRWLIENWNQHLELYQANNEKVLD